MNDGWIRRISNFEIKTHLNQSEGEISSRSIRTKYNFLRNIFILGCSKIWYIKEMEEINF